jgi:undecaprenyl-diphosphatase
MTSLQDIDLAVLQIFNRPFLPYLNVIFILILSSVYIFVIFLAYTFFRNKEKEKLYHLIFLAIVGYAIVAALKILVARERPYTAFPDLVSIISTKSDMSFPSAHTFMSFLCLYFLPKNFPKWLRIIFVIYLVVLIPVGILYIGLHFPSDVLAGAIIGLAMPILIKEKITNKIFKLKTKEKN